MIINMLLALALIYFVMAALFESLLLSWMITTNADDFWLFQHTLADFGRLILLLDLRHRLLENWSPIRSHYAIRAFIAVAEKMGRDPAWWDIPGQMRATSQRYDRRFGGEFRSLAKEFAGSFVKSSFSAEWPYDALEEGDGVRFARKILRRIGFRAALFRNVLIVDGTNFDTKARDYLTELYSRLVPQGTDTVVLNNGV